MLFKFLRIYERFFNLFNEYDSSNNMELELEEYVKFCCGIGIKDRILGKKLFNQMDADHSGAISF